MKENKLISILTVAALGGMSVLTIAADAQDTKSDKKQVVAVERAQPMSVGEVKKIDKEQGKITINHGELKNLGMPSMTMVFRVKDVAMLDKLTVGQKINFIAENVDGALTLVKVN